MLLRNKMVTVSAGFGKDESMVMMDAAKHMPPHHQPAVFTFGMPLVAATVASSQVRDHVAVSHIGVKI